MAPRSKGGRLNNFVPLRERRYQSQAHELGRNSLRQQYTSRDGAIWSSIRQANQAKCCWRRLALATMRSAQAQPSMDAAVFHPWRFALALRLGLRSLALQIDSESPTSEVHALAVSKEDKWAYRSEDFETH